MGMPAAGGKQFQQTPPQKGSFPLDHEGECKPQKAAYMECLKQSGNNARLCREVSKVYLECRMAKQLMAKEDLNKLGFSTPGSKTPK
eukprot:m.96895 g.96895  ORF g.96895 m.96895 type:complete len:87 (+) comp12375_c0_seq8:113-373(+)